MKTTKRFLYFAAVSSFLFAACSREAVAPEENVTPGENNGGTYLVYFGAEAALDDAATGSKATLTEDVTEAGKAIFRSAWEKGEQAYIRYIATGMSQPDYKFATWDSSNGMFSVPFTNNDASNWSYNMLYPLLSEVNFSSNRTQSGSIYNSKYDVMLASAEVTNALPGKDDNGDQLVFNMNRQTGIAYFHFTSSLTDKLLSATLSIDPEGDSFISSDTYRLHNANNFADGFDFTLPKNSITITFDPENTPTADDFCLWFNVLPAKYSSLSLRVITTDHEFTLKKSTAGSYEKANLYKVEKNVVTWKERVAYNVITTVTAGEGTITATPSPAYEGTLITLSEVHDGDKYIFDGYTIECPGYDVSLSDDNTFIMPPANVTVKASFTSKGSDDSSIELSKDGFANCYIVSGAGDYKFLPTKGNSTTALSDINSVEVLWESFGTSTAPNVGDLVNNINYTGGFITFTATNAKGNALIAAKNADDVILWSWHIWLTDYSEIELSTGVTVLDRNLGATSATAEDLASYGLYYQWGRKDPFLNSTMSSTAQWPSVVASSDETGTVAYTINNPMTFLSQNNNNYGWTSKVDHNLWSSTEKTIYDPCPYGYRCATSSICNDTNITGGFPKNGALKNSDKSNYNVGTKIYIWFSDASVKTSAQQTAYYEGVVKNNKYSSYGMSVRCQKK